MQGSKIRLSAAEAQLFEDAEIILTKNTVLQKTVLLLRSVQEQMTTEAAAKGHLFMHAPKISRGENYRGLPYVVLDFPRVSEGPDLFFVRTLFWWGNFYSSTLQLAGGYKEEWDNKVVARFESLIAQDYYVGVNKDLWVHHFEKDNYVAIRTLSKEAFETILASGSHLKIATRRPLSEWDRAADTLLNNWRFLTGLIA